MFTGVVISFLPIFLVVMQPVSAVAANMQSNFGPPPPPLAGAQMRPAQPPLAQLAGKLNLPVTSPVAPTPASNIEPLLQAALAAAPKVISGKSVKPTVILSAPPRPPALMVVEQQQTKSSVPIADVSASALPQGHINQEEAIVHLDYSNINSEVLNKRTANLIYFNANFNKCRNCDRFFSIWKELALDIRWWRHLIRLFTINCSDDDNVEICRRAGVTEFPQLKFYWVMSGSLNQDGQRLRILGKSVHAMRHLITDKLLDSYMEHNRLLAQRVQQRASASAISNPFGALTTLMSPNTAAVGTPGASPLAALMPIISQVFGFSSATSASGTNSSAGAGGLISGLMSMIGGKPGASTTGGDGSTPSLGNLMNSIGGMQGISQMINALMSVASWRRSLTLQPLPSNWPELEPIETTDTQRLLNMLPLDPAKGIAALLIMETQEFLYTGIEVMLDLNPYSNQTYIARVRDERSQLSKNLTGRDDIQAPALIYITEHREVKLIMTAPKYSNDEDLRRAFVRAFEKRQGKHLKRVWSAGGSGQSQIQTWSGSKSQEDEEILARMNNVYMTDLLNTIRASLMEQVFRHSDLSDDQYNALVKYVYALINYFPFNNDEMVKFFKRLHAWLQNQVSPMDIAEYKKQFHDVNDALGKKRDWMACKSLSTINAIPSRGRMSSGSILFENPSQLGKVVSNITRLFRTNQQKVTQLKSLMGMFTSNLSPVMLTNNNQHPQPGSGAKEQLSDRPRSTTSTTTTTTTTTAAPLKSDHSKKDEESSSIEKLMKSLTSGSLGSDSSILKLISTALTGSQDGGGDTLSASLPTSSKSGKSKFAREYSCGAWKLAHVMVVNEYLKDSPRKDVKHIVLHSLYQYMLHFYACTTCGNRVSDISGEFRLQLENHLHDQGDSIMLLWKIHNRINKRLEVEFRPGSPSKQQFPSESLCAKCRATKAQNDSIPTLATPNWQEKQVLHFLVHHYWPQNIIMNLESASTSASGTTLSITIIKYLIVLLTALANLYLAIMPTRLLVRLNCTKQLIDGK